MLKLPDCPPVAMAVQPPVPPVDELELLDEDEELEELLDEELDDELLLELEELEELLEPETVTLKFCMLCAPQLLV